MCATIAKTPRRDSGESEQMVTLDPACHRGPTSQMPGGPDHFTSAERSRSNEPDRDAFGTDSSHARGVDSHGKLVPKGQPRDPNSLLQLADVSRELKYLHDRSSVHADLKTIRWFFWGFQFKLAT